jgi:hypothetical protein
MESLTKMFMERVTNTFYATFAAAWFIVNWRILYLLFYVDENIFFEKTSQIRGEFYFSKFFDITTLDFWINSLLVPFLLTILSIWFFPYFFIKVVKKSEQFRAQRKVERINASIIIKKAEDKLKGVERDIVNKEIDIKKAENSSPETKWTNEYIKFKNSKQYNKFSQIIEAIYTHSGDIEVHNNNNSFNTPKFEVDTDILAYVHSKELVDITRNENISDNISLTSKGKYFVSLYTEDIKKPDGGIGFLGMAGSASA